MLMTMDCPRCGFNQPKDQFCANCGLNVEHFLRQKPPLWRRVLASPRLYATLVGALALFLILFIVTSKVPRLWRATGGTYISSREAADPGDEGADVLRTIASVPDEPVAPSEPSEPSPAAAAVMAVSPPAAARVHYARFESEFWELSNDQTAGLVAGAERVVEDAAGRAVLLHDHIKVREALRTGGRPLGPVVAEDLRANAQLVIETPPAAGDGFRFGLLYQLMKWGDDQRASFRFTTTLSSPPAESEADHGTVPSFRAPIDTSLTGAFELTGADVALIVIEPTNRRPRAELVNRAGPGPWRIFASPNFQVGETDWVVVMKLAVKRSLAHEPARRSRENN